MAAFGQAPIIWTRRGFLLSLPPSLVVWTACGGSRHSADHPWAEVEYLCERFISRRRAPSISLAVSRGGRLVFASAWGYADLEQTESATPRTLFRIASVTKTFIGALFLILQRRGTLVLDEPASRWIPEFPRSREFTVRMLLNHTSGLGEYTERPYEDLVQDAGREYSNEEIVAYMAAMDPLFVREPGTGWEYSNTGYVLLGVVAERAGGAPLPALIARHLTEPVGLEETDWDSRPDRAQRARGYGFRDGQWIRAPYVSTSYIGASGALCSTASDLCRWYDALFGGGVLAQEDLAAMMEPARLADGRSTVRGNGSGYGLGIWTGLADGRLVAWHAGSTAGFAADARHELEEGVSIAMLGNADAGRMGSEPRRIRDAVREALGTRTRPPTASPQTSSTNTGR